MRFHTRSVSATQFPSVALASALLLAGVEQGRAQSLDGYVIERTIRDRWMHARQLPEFTEFDKGSSWIHVDAVRFTDTVGTRQFQLTIRRRALRYPTTIVTDAQGRISRYTVGDNAATPLPVNPERERRLARSILFRGGVGPLELPESVGWDAIPRFPLVDPGVGSVWIDTLDWSAERMGFQQSIRGIRTSTIVSDTSVSGRRIWIVHDSMPARYAERWTRRDWSLETDVETVRSAEGLVRSWYLYDPELGLFLARWDSSRFEGEAVRRLPDGREFRTPAVYEATREWTLRDPDAYEARQAELRAARTRARRGPAIARFPEQEQQRRQWDSLEAIFNGASDRRSRLLAFRTLRSSGPPSPEDAFELRSYALLIGDTTAAVAITMGRRLDVAGFDLLRPMLDDPGSAFSLGIDPGYNALADKIRRAPPILLSDTSAWGCTPEACRMLATEVSRASEPRLRDLALLANLTLAPAAWYERVVERAEQGSLLARQARALADGTQMGTIAAPGPDADWREWREWMGRRIGVPWSGRLPLRFYEARTGVSLVDAFRRRLTAAQADSARLVYGMLLLALDETRPTPEDVAANLDAGSEALAMLGQSQITRLFRGNPEPADEQTARGLIDDLLDYVLRGASVWPGTPENWNPGGQERRIAQGGDRGTTTPQMILVEDFPQELLAEWENEIEFVTREAWDARSDLLPAELMAIGPVLQAGPFAHVSVSWTGRLDRRDVGTPYAWSASQTFYLRRVTEGWIYVTGGRRIT